MSDSTLATEHPDLLASAVDLTAHLGAARGRLVPLGSLWVPHTEFGDRVRYLSHHLRGALLLVDDDLYAQAFAVLRSALEHHVQDHLLFLGNRFKAVQEGVTDETLAEWQKAIAEGRDGFAGVLEVRRLDADRVEVVRTGPHLRGLGEGLDAPSLSIYYRVMSEFNPFTGGKSAQPFIGQWPHSEDAHRRWASQAAETWGRFLSWRQLTANLALNEFYIARELARFQVHYGFLSAFTHSSNRGAYALFGRNLPPRRRYDHYASELVLLYVVTLARLELEVFEEMATTREPIAQLADWDTTHADMQRGEALASHLWFPRGAPHIFDRVQEANRRGQQPDGSLVPFNERPKPEDLAEEDVLYYDNPLKRVISLHAGVDELTGFAYTSPWRRADAWSRGFD